jgi:hypothetical protein
LPFFSSFMVPPQSFSDCLQSRVVLNFYLPAS